MGEIQPGKVTLEVIYDRQERLINQQEDVSALVKQMSEDMVAMTEFRKAATHQLWTPDGNSRMQATENRIGNCEECVRTWNLRYWGAVTGLIVSLSGLVGWTYQQLALLSSLLHKAK